MTDTNDTPNKKPKTSKLAIASIVCLIGFLVILFDCILFESLNKIMPDWLVVTLLVGFFAAVPILSIAALILLRKNSDNLRGEGIAIRAMVAWLILMTIYIIMGLMFRMPHRLASRLVCGSKLKGLGTAMRVYANDYDGQLPTPEKWCDLLITNADISPRELTCEESDAKWGESSYALNKNVIGMKLSEIPGDVVLLFETNFGREESKRTEPVKNRQFYDFLSQQENTKIVSGKKKVYKHRWNQTGGPELLTTENLKGDGCNITFADGHVKFVRDIPNLRWKPEEK